jgi:predicted metalloprotease with PDZ domain
MKRRCSIALAAMAALSLPAHAEEPEKTPDLATPAMTILLKPGLIQGTTGTGDVNITLSVPHLHVEAGQPLFSFGGHVDDLTITDAQGAVPLHTTPDGEIDWTSTRGVDGDVQASYRVSLDNRYEAMIPVTAPRLDGDGFLATGGVLVALPNLSGPCRVAIRWDLAAMGPGATAVSSFGDGDVDLPAGPLSRLQQNMFMAGHLKRQVEPGGFTTLWLGDLPGDLQSAMNWASKLYRWMPPFFIPDGGESPYRVFLRYGGDNPGGGMAMTQSFVVGYGKGVDGSEIQSLLSHEMVHTFTANPMAKWYVEGDAVYYQMQIPWRAGMRTTDEYLKDINMTAASYYTSPLLAMPDEQIMHNYWGDPMKIMLPYDRGAIYFAALNGRIRKASGGKKSVDDLVRTMVSRDRAGQPVDEEAWKGLLREALGEEGLALHQDMMSGTTIVPDSDAYGPCFRRVSAKIRRFDQGFQLDGYGQRRGQGAVASVKPGSEAEKAGIRVGDQVVLSNMSTQGALHDPEMTTDAQITRDGKTFTVTYLPRGEAVDGYQWERVPGSPDTSDRPLPAQPLTK